MRENSKVTQPLEKGHTAPLWQKLGLKGKKMFKSPPTISCYHAPLGSVAEPLAA
jgi:hypothetical protein